MSGYEQCSSRPASWLGIMLIGFFNAALSIVLLAVLFLLWPEYQADGKQWDPIVRAWGAEEVRIRDEQRLFLIVIFTGALGSCVHACTSFASYVGNRRLVLSWSWWYFLRPVVGTSLAIIFYFVVRGGLLSGGGAANSVSVYGVAAVAGLVGMFSKQATDKLREVFDNLFRTEQGQGDDARSDKLGGNISVSSAMIERRKMVAVVIPEGQDTTHVKVADLHRLLGGVITRVPVLTHKDVFVSVLHQSLIYKFLADRSIEAAQGAGAFDASAYTLKDLIDADGMKELVIDAVAFVSENSTLDAARSAMDSVPRCQDVLVTKNGAADEPVIGWLTDAELRKTAKSA